MILLVWTFEMPPPPFDTILQENLVVARLRFRLFRGDISGRMTPHDTIHVHSYIERLGPGHVTPEGVGHLLQCPRPRGGFVLLPETLLLAGIGFQL